MVKAALAGALLALSHLLFKALLNGLFPDADHDGTPFVALVLQGAVVGSGLAVVLATNSMASFWRTRGDKS